MVRIEKMWERECFKLFKAIPTFTEQFLELSIRKMLTVYGVMSELKKIPRKSDHKCRKKLILHILESAKINRGIGQASILLVGSSGVGKSSTVNHLFSMKEGKSVTFAKTSDIVSETRTTTEYILKADDEEFEVKSLELGLVDSPGFNDTDGMRQDACNFFSIKEFYKKHPAIGGQLPNLIFVMVNANDKRIQGENSNLAKSLKCLMSLNLIDPVHPNVIGVITHAGDLAKYVKKLTEAENQARWTKAFEEKRTLIKNILAKHLHVAAEVVTLENDIEDLEEVDDFTWLPDGKTLQPRNLFDACIKVLSANGDQFGQLVVSRVFGKKEHHPDEGFSVPAKDAKAAKLDPEEKEFLDFFQKTAEGEN